ncbi:MAG: hypothetical protein JWO38_1288, partial [Gemmataceae bacterium]|nr:hypothetical protein [Gemmataceae bacterium]
GRNETVEQYRKAIGWGIDLIQTDYPARVFRAIELEATADEGKWPRRVARFDSTLPATLWRARARIEPLA